MLKVTAKTKNQMGFSLLEVIIAIALLASIGVMTINILNDQLSIRSKLTSLNSMQHDMDIVMSRISSDLKAAYITPFRNQTYLNLSYRPVVPQLISKNNDLSFFTFNFNSLVKNTAQSNEAFVRYFIEKEANSEKKNLYRIFDTDMMENISKNNIGTKQLLLNDIKELKFSFWNGKKFIDDWDSTANETMNRLPKLIQVQLSCYFKETTSKQIQIEEKDKRFFQINTVVYLANYAGEVEAETPDWSEFPWL